MHGIARRSFVKTALAGATVVTLGAALKRPANAADDANGVKFAKDPANPQPGAEAAHTPSIALEAVDGKSVAYGKTPAGEFYRVTVQARHEATREHHIYGVALYLNGALIAEHTTSRERAEASLPTVSFVQRLKSGDELLAVTTCNLHGKWGNRTTV